MELIILQALQEPHAINRLLFWLLYIVISILVIWGIYKIVIWCMVKLKKDIAKAEAKANAKARAKSGKS